MNVNISIITPAFNPGKHIIETFQSLENQSFRNFEWIIVDDCSNNENKEFYQQIKSIASFKVTIITNSENYRQAKSKNIGLKHAKGEYIKFLDADDLLDIDHLKNHYESIQKTNLKKHAIYSPTKNFWFIRGKQKEQINVSYKSVINTNIEQLKRFLVFPFFSHCGCLFKKEDIFDINGFDENLITDEDGDFIVRLMFNGVLFFPDERSFYLYRQHNNSRVSRNDSEEKWKNRLKVCKKIEQEIENNQLDLKEQLAQRLDLLGVQSSYSSNKYSQIFFKTARQVFPDYVFPGNKYVRILRRLFGTTFYLKLRKII